MKCTRIRVPLIVLAILLATGCTKTEFDPDRFGSDWLLPWNEAMFRTAMDEDGLLTLKGLRTASMAYLAAHDALNSIVPRYDVYSRRTSGPDAHPQVAAAYAIYTVCMDQYPGSADLWDSLLLSSLPEDEDEKLILLGEVLGSDVARTLLKVRQGDAWDGEAEYQWHPMGPGVYAEFNEHSGTPEGFVFGAGWAKAQPFFLDSPDQFRSPPPPEINSPAYTRAFEEVRVLGCTESTGRTEDQTHYAMWWKDFVENSHNRLARRLVPERNLNLWEATRLFALLNATIYDAYISVFDNKFHYNHWRPYTAIRWASHDGNPDTREDPEWDNLHRHTYAFPSYPSAHGTASAAAMTALADALGTGDTFGFSMRTDSVDRAGPFSIKVAMDPPERTFESFSEAALEASLSRLYLGIHFRYDSLEGYRLGKSIGQYVIANYLKPLETSAQPD